MQLKQLASSFVVMVALLFDAQTALPPTPRIR